MGILAPGERPKFVEVRGVLEAREGSAVANDLVMLTNFQKGSAASAPLNGLTVRYVARGREHYRIGGRSFALSEGQLMIASQQDGAEIDIANRDRAGTLGLCAFIAANDERFLGELPGPIVIGGSCSPVGDLMKEKLKALDFPAGSKPDHAASLIGDLTAHLPGLLKEIADHAANIQASKPSTRYDAFRKVSLARAYLHSTTDRVVDLNELARVAGMSRFHFLRAFQQCLGQSPARYHRSLRLTLAIADAKRRDLSLDAVADKYGFAGASSLSHVHRRTFGRSPVWSRRARQPA